MVYCKLGFINMKKILFIIIFKGIFIIIYLISLICIVIYVSFFDFGSDFVVAIGWDFSSFVV